jgi:hypothetical protein
MKQRNLHVPFAAARTFLACALAASLAAAPARAEDISSAPGAFAPVPLGGRGTALAGAQTAAPSGVEALLYNPAALAGVENWAGGYYYSDMYALVPFNFTAGIYRLPQLQGRPFVVGAAWIQNGDEVYSENEVLLSGAYNRGWVRLGATYKLRFAGSGEGGESFVDPELGLERRVDGSAFGLLGFDVGATIMPWGPKYVMGVAFKDLLSRISWSTSNEAGTAEGDYAEYVPVTLRYGFLFDPDPFLDLVVDFQPSLYHDARARLASGIEVIPLEVLKDGWLKDHIRDLLAMRIGYGRNLFTNEASHRLTLGTGLAYRYMGIRMAVDMGYEWNFNFEDANNLRMGFQVTR